MACILKTLCVPHASAEGKTCALVCLNANAGRASESGSEPGIIPSNNDALDDLVL